MALFYMQRSFSLYLCPVNPFLSWSIPAVPVRLQTLCRGDGLSPEPLRHATLSWSDVTPRPASSPLLISAGIHFHCWQIYFSRLTFQFMAHLNQKKNKKQGNTNEALVKICILFLVFKGNNKKKTTMHNTLR